MSWISPQTHHLQQAEEATEPRIYGTIEPHSRDPQIVLAERVLKAQNLR